jgi:hypothetical protein
VPLPRHVDGFGYGEEIPDTVALSDDGQELVSLRQPDPL